MDNGHEKHKITIETLAYSVILIY